MFICGIDEAGRGPIFGPLVMCGILINEKDVDKLRQLGVTDSKLLTKELRERLYPEIIGLIKDYRVIKISSKEIDERGKQNMNLNEIEAHTSAKIINELCPDKVIVDCPSVNTMDYSAYLRNLLTVKTKVIAEHKADFNYLEVAAASIIAKVNRDQEVEELKREYGEIGSGYLSDPLTIRFLKDNWDKIDIFRKSWSTWQEYKIKKEQKKLFEY